MSSVRSSLVPAGPAPMDRLFGQAAVNGRSRAVGRSLAALGKRSLAIHLMMVTALVLLWKVVGSPGVVLMLGGVIFVAGSLLIARNEARSTPLLITPLSWWFAWQSFTLGLCPIWLGSRVGDLPWFNYVGQTTLSSDNIVEGFVYYAIGSLAMHLGLQFSRPSKAGVAARGNHSSRSFTVIIVLWVCGISLGFFANYFTAIGTFAAPLQFGALSAACSVAIAPPRFMPARSPAYWCAVFLAMAGCLLTGAAGGFKSMIMLSALPLVWILMLRGNLRKSLLVLIPALALSYMYVVEPVMDGLRTINRSADVKSSLMENAQRGTLADVAELHQVPLAEKLDGIVAREFSGIYVGYVVQDTKANGFKMGQTMDYLRYAFIPRLFWPDKPNVSRGAWYTAYLGAALSENSATSASAITAEGELYWNFGLIGMIIGMLALGWLIGMLLWRMAGLDSRENPVRMLALLVTIFLVAGELEAGSLFVTIITDAMVLHFMLLVLSNARRNVAITGTAGSHSSIRLARPAH